MTAASIVHLPDLTFAQHLQREFGINRGVFNTMDAWFYEHGYVEITQRRKLLIEFLRIAREQNRQGRRMRFGHGGLAAKMNDFLMQNNAHQRFS
ncbi:hypothetical protein P4U99_19875 [Brevibacillus agri]|uniref:Uncharacterized protein n=1 Tax=Brevibacillus brevis TaxID=1393 RepID=A0ABY9T5X2_BREBE|nr:MULTISPECIES: hypothetical protein [Brevibacillus]EJL40460.1 hypothetical protein PMI08_04409 [Brevibacillus sp. CF112]MBY0052150.1 hypothetical protein [Brevibacillus agri]MCG5252238.1 hypothetical protein [Brevibacillus agri]MDN4093961.1 hypothetical protein [Brevibacillus agri]MDR9507123.1 hypothetical protein [Brevibacillus agri]